MRADARRNHERLLAAARDEFAAHGPDAPLDDIARRAGLGSGTLYRHFPTRDALIRGVYRAEIDTLCARGRELIEAPAPAEALSEWLRILVETTGGHGLAPALMGGMRERPSRFIEACHEAIRAAAGPLLRRAQDAGAVRADVELTDLLSLTHAIASAHGGPERAARLLSLMMEGVHGREGKSPL